MNAAETTRLQSRLGVTPDGTFGPATWAELFSKMGATPQRAHDLADGANSYVFARQIDTPLRLSHFMAQTAHESDGYHYMEEIWGPTPAQARYEGRLDLGNTEPGDGHRYKGRGVLQITGRANYRHYGMLAGLDLEGNPEMAAEPAVGVRIACLYWDSHGLNTLADVDDTAGITRKINGGLNGLDDRRARLTQAKALLL